MLEKTVLVNNKSGLHARPASRFVKEAKAYQSDIMIYINEENANAKSMISVLGLGVNCGAKLLIRATGADEEEAVNGLSALLQELAAEEA